MNLKRFFEEKDLGFVEWELKDDQGNKHIISNEVVIEAVLNAPKIEREGISNKLLVIDFKNGDVNDYLKHLAGALINR
ncbi:MAG: hypothetical protein AWU54_451 [Candidatus Frackibacter sp. T328-2]|nr:MAG: hypothetical protein AWU54_451 [Candidatus Frackibacter sp. T328-2]